MKFKISLNLLWVERISNFSFESIWMESPGVFSFVNEINGQLIVYKWMHHPIIILKITNKQTKWFSRVSWYEIPIWFSLSSDCLLPFQLCTFPPFSFLLWWCRLGELIRKGETTSIVDDQTPSPKRVPIFFWFRASKKDFFPQFNLFFWLNAKMIREFIWFYFIFSAHKSSK